MALADILLNPGFFATYAAVQAIALLLIFRSIEPFEPQPLWVLFLLVLWGGTGAALIALFGNEAVRALLPANARDVFGDAVAPPIVEELAKGVALVAAVFASSRFARDFGGWQFAGPAAGLVCGAAIGIGFGFTEDFFYFVNHAGSEGVDVGADVFLGRRDFFGPTALHHPLFTAAFGAGIGAAVWSTSWTARVFWPLIGLTVAVLMHAVNNGLVEFLLVQRHGLEVATSWVNDRPVSAQVQSTADNANNILIVVDYLFIAVFMAGAILWQRHARRSVAAELEQDVEAGLLSPDEVSVVSTFGRRTRAYFRLLVSANHSRLRRQRSLHGEIARLGLARWRVRRGRAHATVVGDARRRVVAALGLAEAPGKVEASELALVGRGRELEALTNHLITGDARQVTITGPGGTGKTRLARELAIRLGSRFAHGAYFVDLSERKPDSEVASAVAQALEVQLPAGEKPSEWLGRLFRDREMLLVLDNFEHLLGEGSLVSSLVRAAKRLRVVVTSRVVLGVPGETEFYLEPLSSTDAVGGTSPAVKLFIDRARRVGATIEEPQDLPQVEDICHRLDGLPLAIELVAARLRVLSLAAVSEGLGQILDLAATGGPSTPARQRTLRGSIAWSEGLLAGPARQLFRDLASFPAGCRLDGLKKATTDSELIDTLQGLADSSLIRMKRDPGGEPRYRMLATIREYANERRAVTSDSKRSVDLPKYCRAIIDTAATPEMWGVDTHRILDQERQNLLQGADDLQARGQLTEAIKLIISAGSIWERGGAREVRARLSSLLEIPDEVPPSVRAPAHRWAGRLALLQGEYDSAKVLLRAALSEANEDSQLRFQSLVDLGWVLTFTGDLKQGEAAFQAAYDQATTLGAVPQAQAGTALGRVRAERGDPNGARRLVAACLEMYDSAGEVRGATSALSTLARLDLLDWDARGAEAGASEALERADRFGDRLRQAEALYPLSTALALLDRDDEAVAATARRLDLCTDLGDALGIGEVLDHCALLLRRQDRDRAQYAVWVATTVRDDHGAQRWPWDIALLERYFDLRPTQSITAYSDAKTLTEAMAFASELLTQLNEHS